MKTRELVRTLGLSLSLAVTTLPAHGATPAASSAGRDASTPAEKKDRLSPDTFKGLTFRSLGPALAGGRVSDLLVHPTSRSTWWVAVASGGVWKTVNAGTTWTPVFDKEGSYSIGCLALDPKNPLIVWVGTGENNSQRSVSYGDGIYRSTDGGKSWENLGLKTSEHLAKILVDPRDTRRVLVASQGPLWRDGGERGLFATTDGGKTWKSLLPVSERTGVTDVLMDPRFPDVLYAATYQRRRHVFTLVNGGPESAIWKSTDSGASWKKLEKGLPKGDVGRIGLAIPPSSPDTVYALVEAADPKEKGFYRSTDMGGSWERMSDHSPTSPQYYQRIFPDPLDERRVYSMDTFMRVTEDGGKTFRKVPETYKHVDNHAFWIDPDDTAHLIAGCDGGLYESWDRGATWDFKSNLPVLQLYRATVDDARPFYNVYGGTQDNNSVAGPSRTDSAHGITNASWFVTSSGDGFVTQVDPEDPSTVYSESQYGGLVRFDRRTGEATDIRPHEMPGEPALRFNWDSPLLLSPHKRTRLYFAAQRLFRSEDRGDSWTPVSPDLTRQVDRNKLPVMGRVQSADAVAKNTSTSFYGNIVSLAESPRREGLLYVGTDDGLVQVSEDGGASWRKLESFPGVPAGTYVTDLEASRHAPDVVYAAFGNHQNGDFKPYLLKSADRGRTWTSLASSLPERGSVHCVAEDPVSPTLLFAGTEFGVFFSTDGGGRWVQLKGGLPTIAVRDLAIQPRAGDLVLATFGRGFYVLDDDAPLREASLATLEREATLFPVRKGPIFVPRSELSLKEKSMQGDSFYTAPNPPDGTVFTYYLRDELKTRKAARQEQEKKLAAKGEGTPYPTWDALRAEDREEEPAVLLTISDEDGNVVRRLTGPVTEGFSRVAWDMRLPAPDPVALKPVEKSPWDDPERGPLVPPGTYRVQLAKRVDGVVTSLGEPLTFSAESLHTSTLGPAERKASFDFARKTWRLQRAVLGAVEAGKEAQKRIDHLRKGLLEAGTDIGLLRELQGVESRLKDVQLALTGDSVRRHYQEPDPLSISERVARVVSGHWGVSGAPTRNQTEGYDLAARGFADALPKLTRLLETDLPALEEKADATGAPFTPGRVPRWKPE